MSERAIDLGVVGVSPGNGHPYSFSAIVNGYSEQGFDRSEWDVIYDYLRSKHDSEFGFPGVSVTHAWTQDPDETDRLCAAAKIPTGVDRLADLVEAVDAVLIARDDYETHLELARPFLDRGIPTFVDKPLAVDPDELATFRPYLEDGLLLSCSGMRYARELDDPRADQSSYGGISLVEGTVIKNWETYGVHLLDAIFGVLDVRPKTVTAIDDGTTTVTITTTGEPTVQLNTIGSAPVTFDVDIYGRDRVTHHQLRDNFRAFRRTLSEFIELVRTGEPTLSPQHTLDVLRTIVAGRRSMERQTPIDVADVEI